MSESSLITFLTSSLQIIEYGAKVFKRDPVNCLASENRMTIIRWGRTNCQPIPPFETSPVILCKLWVSDESCFHPLCPQNSLGMRETFLTPLPEILCGHSTFTNHVLYQQGREQLAILRNDGHRRSARPFPCLANAIPMPLM